MSINRATVSGWVCNDPSVTNLPNDNKVLNGTVVVHKRRKNRETGEWENYPNFIPFSIFGSRVPYYQDHMHKGSRVVITGELNYQSWQNETGQHSKIQIIADDIELILPPRDKSENTQQNNTVDDTDIQDDIF